MNKYSYNELEAKALSPEATQTDIDNLGKWFELHGLMFWNGEYYEINSNNRLYPVYRETEPDEFELVRSYEIR